MSAQLPDRDNLVRHLRIIAWTTAVLVLLTGLVGGIIVSAEAYRIHQDHNSRQATVRRNHFWLMLAGQAPTDRTTTGRLATKLQLVMHSHNPLRGLDQMRIVADDFKGINGQLGLTTLTAKSRGDAAYVHLNKGFVIKAAQATPETVTDLIESPQPVRQWGRLRWTNMVAITAVPLALGLLTLVLALLSYALRMRSYNRRRRQWLDSLTPSERELQGLKAGIDAMPYSLEKRQALNAWDNAWQKLQKLQEGDRQVDARAQIQDLVRTLDAIVASNAEGAAVYRRQTLGETN